MTKRRESCFQCNHCWEDVEAGQGYATDCNHVFCVRFILVINTSYASSAVPDAALPVVGRSKYAQPGHGS